MTTLILVLLCWILAAVCTAVNDTIAFKYKMSIFHNLDPDYWNPAKSWRNKYKNKTPSQGPAFIGSTTIFSFLTDAWHLFQFLGNSLQALSVVVIIDVYYSLEWYSAIASFLVVKTAWNLIFELLYRNLLKKKR